MQNNKKQWVLYLKSFWIIVKKLIFFSFVNSIIKTEKFFKNRKILFFFLKNEPVLVLNLFLKIGSKTRLKFL